jgi:conjugal transfer pilus assembly protein TraK
VNRSINSSQGWFPALMGAGAHTIAHTVVRAVMCCLAVVCASTAGAATTLEIRDGDTTISKVSVRDQTRVRVERGRVVDVIGDVFDSERNPGGRIVVLKDDAQGEIYIRPVLPAALRAMDGSPLPGPLGNSMAPIKLDVKTDRGTVGLVLQPADVIGDTLTLRITGTELRPTSDVVVPKNTAHVRAAKALTLAMASSDLAGEVPMRRLAGGGREIALWKEARFVQVARYDVPGLVGEVYELTNVSAHRMVIDERELYRPGVVSVSLRALVLAPGASTAVWVVRQAEDGD